MPARELVGSIASLPEDDPPHQELLEDLATLRNMAAQKSPPVHQAYFHVLLDLLEIARGN